MGLFSCFTAKSARRQRPRRPSRKMRNRASGRHSGLTVRTSGIPANADLLSIYGSPTSGLSEDDHFHDAMEETFSSMSSRSSNGGNTPARDATIDGFSDEEYESDNEEGLIDKITNWWQHLRNESPPTSGASGAGAGGAVASSSGVVRNPKPTKTSPFSATSNRNSIPHIPPPSNNTHTNTTTAIIETDEPPPLSGCINLFTATQVIVAQRKFLSTIKPKAGSSFKKLPLTSSSTQPAVSSTTELNPLEAVATEEGEADSTIATEYTYQESDPMTFFVRSKDYMKTKIKEPAQESIYTLLGVDMYSFDTKLDHISQYIDLPTPPTLGPEALALPENERLPPLLIFNLQCPTYPPSVFGGNDGPGHSLVYYFALPEGWEPSMVENKAALGLAQRFFSDGIEFDGQPTRDRLKLLPRVVNVEEWGVKGPLSGAELRLLRNYNGKPILTRPQHRFYSNAERQYAEIVLDIHQFAYIARRAFSGFVPRLSTVIFEDAFVLQGNRAEELPEVLLAAVKLYHVDFTKQRPFPAERLEQRGNHADEDGNHTSA